MLSKARQFEVGGARFKTPIILPSFSSKVSAEDKIRDILNYAEGFITDEILISAYDLSYKEIPSKIQFASLVFLDSGGYEASQDIELSDVRGTKYKPRSWNSTKHKATLKEWDFRIPTVIVSYDHPRVKTTIPKQIHRAKSLFNNFPNCASEILFKTETKREPYVPMEIILSKVHELSSFQIIGLTEKELGNSVLKRMANIARLRTALDEVNLNPPIHIFGSLDTIITPLYFLAGADIFDGLTWLRYGFHDGHTIYRQAAGVLQRGVSTKDFQINAEVWAGNFHYMRALRDQMRIYLQSGIISKSFKHHADFFDESLTLLYHEIGV